MHDPFALPDGLRGIVRRRLEQVEPSAMELLQQAALLAAPRIEKVAGILPVDKAVTLLGEVEDQGIILLESDGSILFAHPLLAAGVVAAMSASRRRALHRHLSEIVDDPEERARHLAMSTIGADPVVVQALDRAAEHARQRGAPSAAAALLELAAEHGPYYAGRACLAAQDHFNAGNPSRARELLEAAVDDLAPGTGSARAKALLGIIHFDTDGRSEAIGFLEQAIELTAGDIELRCSIMVDLSFVLFICGRIEEALQQTASLVDALESIEDRGLIAEILAASVIIDFLSGKGLDEESLNRAIELEDQQRRSPVRRWPSTVAAQVYRWTHRVDLALASFADIRRRCLDNGFESDLWFVSLGAIPAACWAGDLETARALTDDALVRSRVVDSDQATAMALMFETQLLAWIGDIDAARAVAAQAAELFSTADLNTIGLEIPAALGMVELSNGDYEAAARHLAPAARSAIEMRFVNPASAQFLPDAVEALIGTGNVNEAELIVDLLETNADRQSAFWVKAVALRSRGLLLAASGMPQEADEHFARALAAHDYIPQLRYDRARTLLVRAAVLRRLNQRRAARQALLEAAGLFEQVGAARWARHALAGLPRLGMQPSSGEALTPSEEQVARLAATGMTNREVAAALSVSPKTVESHLTNIYRKLEIRSRAELGWHMAQRSTDE
jgi:ATP/maltotriose-dependent transcriptional regulator MalT